MMYLIIQTWLFIGIAWLTGIAIGFGLSRDQKSLRHRDTEEQLRDARNRQIALEKEVEEFRARVTELEGLPEGVRASRVAAREEMVSRIAMLERDVETARASEKRLGEEAERLRNDVDGFRTRYLEARAKWDEYQAKAEALASQPAPLTLGEAHVVPDDSMRRRVMELEGLLTETVRVRERAADQAKTLAARVSELEGQLASAGKNNGGDAAKALKERIAVLEAQLLVGATTTGDGAQAKALNARVAELEGQLATAGKSQDQSKLLQARIGELEGRLAAGINAAREADALKTRVADLQDKLGEAEIALRKTIGAPKADGEPLRARIGELEAQLAATRSGSAPAGDGVTLKSVAEITALRARVAEAEARLAETQREANEAAGLRARLAEFEGRGKSLLATNDEEVRRLQTRTSELEKALENARAQAKDAQSLRAQVASLESRLAAADGAAERGATGEDVSLLKARLADVEARLMASSGASSQFESLRSRVMTLESLLHEAAKSRDEAAILRSKVAELDGRLGQAMKAAETRPCTAESEKV